MQRHFPFINMITLLTVYGVHRALLPKSKEDFLISSFEYLVENVSGEDDFFIMNYKDAKGYLWYFPLDGGRGYIGALDMTKDYSGIDEFFHQHPEAKIIKKIGRPLRLSPPKRMKPLCDGNVIGVGESIGCVFPMTGEGIAPSLLCSAIFQDVLVNSSGSKFNFRIYEENVLNAFDYYDDAYKILKFMLKAYNQNHHLEQMDLKKLVINNPQYINKIKEMSKVIDILSTINK